MNARGWVSIAALLAALAGSDVRAAPPAVPDTPVVVGLVATLSGPEGMAGQDVVDGFHLALKDLGQRLANREVHLVEIDEKGSPDLAVASTRRMIEADHPQFVVTAVNAASLSAMLSPLAGAGAFVLNLENAPTAIAGPGCAPWLFDTAGLAEGAHEAAGAQMAADGVRRLVVIGPSSAPTRDAVEALKRTFPGEVAAIVTPHHGEMDFSGEVAHIREAKPDAVYDLLTGGMGVEFVRAWGRSGLKAEAPLYAPWWGFEPPAVAAMGDAALDATTLGSWSPDLDIPSSRRLVTEFETEYGRQPTAWAAQGYDAAYLLDAALKGTKGATGDMGALRTAIRHVDFPSVRGTFRFNSNHFAIMTYYSRKVVRDSKGRMINEMRNLVLKDWRDGYAPACPMRWEETLKPKPNETRKKR